MALAAGRVGVSPQDVDARGHITSVGGLTPEQAAKLDKALVSPLTAPLEKEIVGVGTGNEQIMVKVGDGLELSGATSPYTLKADGSSGGLELIGYADFTVTPDTTSGYTMTLYEGKTVAMGDRLIAVNISTRAFACVAFVDEFSEPKLHFTYVTASSSPKIRVYRIGE